MRTTRGKRVDYRSLVSGNVNQLREELTQRNETDEATQSENENRQNKRSKRSQPTTTTSKSMSTTPRPSPAANVVVSNEEEEEEEYGVIMEEVMNINDGIDDDMDDLRSEGEENSSNDEIEEQDEEQQSIVETDISEDEDELQDSFDYETIHGGIQQLQSTNLDTWTSNGWKLWNKTDDPLEELLQEKTDLYEGYRGPTPEVVAVAETGSALDLFFFFLPKRFWIETANQCNIYELQTRNQRIEARLQKAVRRAVVMGQELDSAGQKAKIEQSLRKFKKIEPHEILIFLGLLLARALCPQKRRLSDHWNVRSRGAIPAGTFSKFMTRARFDEIKRFLHFANNEAPEARVNRAWKIMPVVNTIQETFLKGYILGTWVSFDEMVIPSRSSQNTVRMYLKNKPHKYGTKLFAMCCGITHYCTRIEVYCGAKNKRKDPSNYQDYKGGPVAVLRNIKVVWPIVDKTKKRIIVTDREYTAVALAIRLKAMGFYSLGTVKKTNKGFPQQIKLPGKKAPSSMLRGSYAVCIHKDYPDLFALRWIDNNPVYLLGCGVSAVQSTTKRKLKTGERVTLPCPRLLNDYNQYMNGVDCHDQLRLQRYSIQRSIRAKKYYLNLFYGLLDIAIVNAFIIHKEYAKNKEIKSCSHAKFLMNLHEEMIAADTQTFQENRRRIQTSLPVTHNNSSLLISPTHQQTTTHELIQTIDKNNKGYHLARACKVCSLLRDGTKRVPDSSWYCKDCRINSERKVYLCSVARHMDKGNNMTCFQIWHLLWENGERIPLAKPIRFRKPAK
jgi:hypothetical protein